MREREEIKLNWKFKEYTGAPIEYFYMLKNINTNQYYFGQTKLGSKRLSQHQAKKDGFSFTHYMLLEVYESKKWEEGFMNALCNYDVHYNYPMEFKRWKRREGFSIIQSFTDRDLLEHLNNEWKMFGYWKEGTIKWQKEEKYKRRKIVALTSKVEMVY